MEFENLVCGSCGGTDFQKLSDLEYRCNHCHGLLIRSAKWETPRPVTRVMAEPEELEVVEASPVFVKTLVGLMVGIFIVGVLAILIKPRSGSGTDYQVASRPQTPSPTPNPAKLKTEVIGKIKGSFGVTHIKCMLTNTGPTVIVEPSVALILYKDDIKLDTVYGDAALKYLKPGVATPVWIPLYKNEDYTKAVIEEKKNLKSIDNPERVFPELKFSDTAMKIETGISTFNDRPYKEKFFDVSGTIQNELYDKISPQLFVIYYDSKSQVVGVVAENPPELMRGEKTKFDVSAGETHLFGAPVRFEILAVAPKFATGPCLANRTC